MGEVGSAVKNLVFFRAVESEKISVKTPEEFINVENLLIPSISSIHLPIPEILVEPPEVANAAPTPEILQIHQIHKNIQKNNYSKVLLCLVFQAFS